MNVSFDPLGWILSAPFSDYYINAGEFFAFDVYV